MAYPSLVQKIIKQYYIEADMQKQIIRLAKRITDKQLNPSEGGGGGGEMITPEGYEWPGGATVAPVSIVEEGDSEPTNAALVLRVERTEIEDEPALLGSISVAQ